MKQWRRRDFLRAAGLGGVATALSPLLPRLGEAQGDSPKRLLLIQHGNGSVLQRWRQNDVPFQSGEALPALTGPILSPLDRHREDLLLLDGLDLASIYQTAGFNNRGHSGASVLWTGDLVAHGGPSVDQVIAGHIGNDTAFRSLQVGAWQRPNDPRDIYSYEEGGVPLRAQLDPGLVFDELFGGGVETTDPGDALRVQERARRRLALLQGELGRLRAQVPRVDRERLEGHVRGLETLVGRIESLSGPQRACEPGSRPMAAANNGVAVLDAQMELIKTAFACDRTRVASLTLCPENAWGNPSFVEGWDTGLAGAHFMSHNMVSTDASIATRAADSMTALMHWLSGKVADVIDMLKSVEEAPGETLFDNTTIVWGTAMSHGGRHVNRNAPFVVAQGANGGFQTGRYLRWGEYEQSLDGQCAGLRHCHLTQGTEANNHLLVSLCHEFGLDDQTTFGDARFTGPLEGLV